MDTSEMDPERADHRELVPLLRGGVRSVSTAWGQAPEVVAVVGHGQTSSAVVLATGSHTSCPVVDALVKVIDLGDHLHQCTLVGIHSTKYQRGVFVGDVEAAAARRLGRHVPAAHHSAREVAAATRSMAHIMFSASKHCCELSHTVTARCCCYDLRRAASRRDERREADHEHRPRR